MTLGTGLREIRQRAFAGSLTATLSVRLRMTKTLAEGEQITVPGENTWRSLTGSVMSLLAGLRRRSVTLNAWAQGRPLEDMVFCNAWGNVTG